MTKEELEKEKCELLGILQGKDKVITDLQKENAKLRSIVAFYKVRKEAGRFLEKTKK